MNSQCNVRSINKIYQCNFGSVYAKLGRQVQPNTLPVSHRCILFPWMFLISTFCVTWSQYMKSSFTPISFCFIVSIHRYLFKDVPPCGYNWFYKLFSIRGIKTESQRLVCYVFITAIWWKIVIGLFTMSFKELTQLN